MAVAFEVVPSFVQTIRLAAMTVAVLFSIITLGLSADFTMEEDDVFAVMGIIVSLLTLLTLPVLIVVDFLRQGAFTSRIAVELGWLGILWVLWLATGADAGISGCLSSDSVDGVTTCQEYQEYQAIEAFAFLIWIVLMGYWMLLLIVSVIGATRGHPIWTSAVKDNVFFTPRANEARYPQQHHQTAGQYGQAQQCPPQQYPPQQVVQQGPQGSPNPMPSYPQV